MKPCEHCFKRIKVPETWETPDTVTILYEHEDSADPEEYDETDHEVATDTEDYVYKPTAPGTNAAATSTTPVGALLLDTQGRTGDEEEDVLMNG